MNKITHFIRLLILMAAVLALPIIQASAALLHCRTDPIFKLSNGDVVNVTLDISTDAINVRNVTYTLHVPAGVAVKQVIYTAGGIGTKEMYKVYQDSPNKTYTADIVVTTQNTGSIPVTATVRLNSIYAQSVSGTNGQHLVVTVSKP
jgi:hypothetical protein